jgi:hypothetical protein
MMHHKNSVLPASHKKVVLGCRGPNIDPDFDKNENDAKLRLKICEKMVWRLEQDILEYLGSDEKRTHFQHCSSDESSRAPTVNTFMPNVL